MVNILIMRFCGMNCSGKSLIMLSRL